MVMNGDHGGKFGVLRRSRFVVLLVLLNVSLNA